MDPSIIQLPDLKLSIKMINFVYDKMALDETHFISIWHQFKEKYPKYSHTPIQFKLLFANILKKINDFDNYLTEYQKKYFKGEKLLMLNDETLGNIDHVEGKDFSWYCNVDMNQYLKDMDNGKDLSMLIATNRMLSTGERSDIFELRPDLKKYFNYILLTDEEKEMDILLDITEIKERLQNFHELHYSLPQFEDIMKIIEEKSESQNSFDQSNSSNFNSVKSRSITSSKSDNPDSSKSSYSSLDFVKKQEELSRISSVESTSITSSKSDNTDSAKYPFNSTSDSIKTPEELSFDKFFNSLNDSDQSQITPLRSQSSKKTLKRDRKTLDEMKRALLSSKPRSKQKSLSRLLGKQQSTTLFGKYK